MAAREFRLTHARARELAADVVQRVRTALPDVLHSVAQEGGGAMLDRLAASVTATAAEMATRLGV